MLVNAPFMLPEPLAAIPVTLVVLSLVQLYVVLALPPEGTMVVIAPPEQIVCEDGVPDTATELVLTVTADVTAVPLHPFNLGVMVNVTVEELIKLVFVNVPEILPVPLEAMPVTEDVLLLVQL